MSECTLIDVTPDFITDGIFTTLSNLGVPWGSFPYASLNLEYYGNVSGQKHISPLVEYLIEENGTGELTSDDITSLATILYNMYQQKWYTEYATLYYSYDPIENYSMTETMTDDTTTKEYGATNTTDSATYGFNSSDAVPADTQTSTNGGSDTETHSYTLTRSGNIGVTTTQQMINAQRDLWKWDFFREIVFPDIDQILTLTVY